MKSVKSQLQQFGDDLKTHQWRYLAAIDLKETMESVKVSWHGSGCGGNRGDDRLTTLISTLDTRISEADAKSSDLIDDLKMVDTIIDSLDNPRWRLCLTLRYTSCLRWREIGKVMEITEQAAKNIEQRAIEWLEMKRRGAQ